MADNIGYPANWTSYESVSVKSDNFFGNLIQLQQFSYNNTIGRLHERVDPSRWQMTTPTVNAYYDPSYNTINFPAGIIQPIFFDASYHMAVNFGGIGMVMGHELTHGFDDQGSQYDGSGKLRAWWPPQVVTRFEKESECIVRQYSEFVYNGNHINGNLTLGENIADNGGIRSAYRGYKLYEADNGVDDNIVIPGYNNDQLFFIAFAQSWCQLLKPEYAYKLITGNEHSLPFARVLGPLTNFDVFGSTFKCPVGSPMNPPDNERCNLW